MTRKMSSPYDLSKPELTALATHAIASKAKAYCPYSNFRVGAAILLDDGTYHTGANVEVVSTPNGACAERVCIFPVVASYKRPHMPVIRALAVSTDVWPPSSPCGMCRQSIREFCEPEMKVFMYGRKFEDAKDATPEEEAAVRDPVVMTIGELLPMAFQRVEQGGRGPGLGV